MMFCKKCGSMMLPVEKKKIFQCSCGFTAEGTVTFTETETKETETIGIAEEKNINPLIDAHCKKCGHDKAHYWVVQTRSADEPPTRFFKCQKCGHTWREK